MSFGSRIKEARLKLGLTQEELAKKINISKGAIGNYEADISRPKEDILIVLMKILNVDANFIYQDYIKSIPNSKDCENDIRKAKLIHNYESLNQAGKDKLVEYSEDLTYNPNYKLEKIHKIKIAARNGRFEERTVTDSDIEKLKNLPDMDDDI